MAGRSDGLVIDADALEIPLVEAVDTFVYLYFVMPAQIVEFCHIRELAQGAVRFG